MRAPRFWNIELRLPTASAETLAAFRIAVGLVLLFSTELHGAERIAALPPALRIAPDGLGWFIAHVPVTAELARAARAIAVFGAVATLVGVYTRVASSLLFLATFYLLSIGQLTGTIIHDMHLVWFAAILAASPCSDAWSVDARWTGAEDGARPRVHPSSPSPRYGVPVWTARLLLGCVYFFPGIHKFASQGVGWFLSDNLALQLHWKWFEWGEVPNIRLDHHPWLLAAGGASVMAFEIGFPLMLITRRTRAVAAALGLAFHLTTERVFRIPFSSLWLCYPVLLDWPWWRRAADPPASDERRVPRLGSLVSAVLLIGAIVQGIRGHMQSFPFACYPTFEHRPPREVGDLRVVAVSADGRRTPIPHGVDGSGVRSQLEWGMIWALAGLTSPIDHGRLLGYATRLYRSNPQRFEGAVRVEMRRSFHPVAPEARGRPPVRDELLLAIPIQRLTGGANAPLPR